MGLIVKSYTFSPGATIVASEHNTNFDTLYNVINGNLDNDNIKSSAGIVASKLDLSSISEDIILTGSMTTDVLTTDALTINSITLYDQTTTDCTTLDNIFFTDTSNSSYVRRTSINQLIGLASGGSSGNQISVVSFSYDANTTGSEAITGAGFQPDDIIVIAASSILQHGASWGFYNGSTNTTIRHTQSSGSMVYLSSQIISIDAGGSNANNATVSSLDSDGVTFTKTKSGTPTWTCNGFIIFIKNT